MTDAKNRSFIVRDGGFIGGPNQKEFGAEKAYWDASSRRFVSEEEYDAHNPKSASNLQNAPQTAAQKQRQPDPSIEARERYVRQHGVYSQRLGQLRGQEEALRQQESSDARARALAERTFHANEVIQKITPDVVKELTQRYTALSARMGGRSSDEIVPKIHAAFRELATSDPAKLEDASRGFEALKRYADGPYKHEMAEITAACQKNNISLQAFSAAVKKSQRSEKIETLGAAIREEYGTMKRVARMLSFGFLFSGKRKAEKLLQTFEPKYKAAENQLTRLSIDFGSTLDIDRIVGP